MSIFKKKKPESEMKTYKIPYSNHFKGFHHFLVSVYKNEEAEKNNRFFLNIDLSDSAFEFVCIGDEPNRFAKLLIDGLEVGTIYDSKQIKAIESGNIEKIHARPKENDDRLTFFVKYKE